MTPLTVEFTTTATPPKMADQERWFFGDGSSSSQPYPQHTYTQTGEWDVLTKTRYITATAVGGELVTRTITYTYDSLYRLTEADYSSGENFQYSYDAVGNRTVYTATVESTQVTTYSYDAANRPCQRRGCGLYLGSSR